MRTEGKVSKVAICERCGKFLRACHVDSLSKEAEKEFTEFTNEGYTVKLETIEETQNREMGFYNDCKSGKCK